MICRSMGYDGAARRSSYTITDWSQGEQGSGQIWFDELDCPKGSTRLDQCSNWAWGVHNCGHHEDVFLQCINFRLVGGASYNEGRVELSVGGVWGTWCDDDFGNNAGDMVCQLLGFSGASAIHTAGHFNTGDNEVPDQIWLDDTHCEAPSGFEGLYSCGDYFDFGVHNCGHHEDAGVTCSTVSAEDGTFRLVNGGSENEGRVEVAYNGRWGTVCDDSFDQLDADMICRSLGYSGASAAYPTAHFGEGTGEIWLDDLNCPDGATNVFDCGYNGVVGFGYHNCQHYEDAGVTCFGQKRKKRGGFGVPQEEMEMRIQYTHEAKNHVALYNVVEDPSETTDLAGEMPEKVVEMASRLAEHWSTMPNSIHLETSQEARDERFGGKWMPGWCPDIAEHDPNYHA